MLKPWIGIGLAVLVLGGLQLAVAQRSTEIFISIGKSPGVSETLTIIGTIDAVSGPNQNFTVSEGEERYTVKVNEGTQIWLDNSALDIGNKNGSFADLQPARRVEVKYREPERRVQVTAEWIKVEMR